MAEEQSTPFAFGPGRYLSEVPADRVVTRVTFAGEPHSKSRNLSIGSASRAYQESLAAMVREQIGESPADAEWAFGVRAAFYVGTYQRKDADNMLKAVVDALTGLVFADDDQVKEVMAWCDRSAHAPRVDFVVYRMAPIERESGACIRCGAAFRRYASWRLRLFCSRRCCELHHRTRVELSCAHCGRSFTRIPAAVAEVKGGKHYCSRACKSLHNRTPLTCTGCGVSLSRPNSKVHSGQKRFFCSVACRLGNVSPRKATMSPERLTASARKGWETRRAKRAAN